MILSLVFCETRLVFPLITFETVIFAVDKATAKENVLIIYCKDADSAKTVNGDIKELYKSIKDNAKENDSEADVKSGKSGNVVYIGTSAGVKAAG